MRLSLLRGLLYGIACLGLAHGIHAAVVNSNGTGALTQVLEIPRLAWEPRSDWLNVKQFGAKGDGVADDTAAIQAVYIKLGTGGQPRVVYFPPGTYRITNTLTIAGDISGIAILGHGRDTVLAWDGPQGGSIYWSNGVHRSRYEGLTYDGRGKAGIGSEHRSMKRYETHIIYQHCAFLNMEYGIAVSKNERVAASAEIWYNNVLFNNTGTGLLLNRANDYDHWLTGCVFVDSGIGINCSTGHFNVYNSHFIRSKTVDIRSGSPCHPPSIRWCTSTNSQRFYESGPARHTQPVALQNNHIDGWKATDGAIRLGKRGPNLIFDNIFVNPPNPQPPIRLINNRSIEPWTEQLVVHGNNHADQSASLIDPGPFSRSTEIPKGKLAPAITTGKEWFFRDTVDVTGKVIDAKRDFGAKGDGRTDDTQAIQRTIDAARAHGRGAIAYLPLGHYKISATLEVTGADYAIESTGFQSKLIWNGATDGVMMQVIDPRNVRIEHLEMSGPNTVTRIRQVSKGQPSSIYYNNLHVTGVYDKTPGLELVRLPTNAEVRMGLVAGFVRAIDCGQATIFGQVHVGRLQVEGAALPKTGFLGFLYHNTAIHEYVVLVKDNQDLVVGDLYNESNDRFLLAEGGTRPGKGRITIGLSKTSTHESDSVHINNYEGRIWLSTGGWQNQKNPTGAGIILRHRGERPVNLLLVGNAFSHIDPVPDFGKGLRLIAIENALWALQKARTYDNLIPEGSMGIAVEALDDFRQLGIVNRKLTYQ
ncbi:MAG: glycosyl hydrolase family 28-related protein [Armatimonadota bacterium]